MDIWPVVTFMIWLILQQSSLDTVFAASRLRRPYKRVCYVASWSSKRFNAEARMQIDDIDPFICTHVIYAFAKIELTNLTLLPAEWDDASTDSNKGNYMKLNELKNTNRQLKTLISIGGANVDSRVFESLVENDETAERFCENVGAFLQRWNWDGIDIDWEFPGDPRQFTALLKPLRTALQRAGRSGRRRYLLTAAVSASEDQLRLSYHVLLASQLVDFFNVMTYDYHGSWNGYTGGSAPLLPRVTDHKFDQTYNVEASVQLWLRHGAPRHKLVVGLTAQGRSFTLAHPDRTGVGVPTLGPGLPGPLTQTPGSLAYFEVCDFLGGDGVRREWDRTQLFPYAYRANQWVSYDNVRSHALKGAWVMKMRLGGIMFWSLDLDDYNGEHCGQGPFPLATTVRDVLEGKRNVNINFRVSQGNIIQRATVPLLVMYIICIVLRLI